MEQKEIGKYQIINIPNPLIFIAHNKKKKKKYLKIFIQNMIKTLSKKI